MTLEAIKHALEHDLSYPVHLIDDQASWLFEQYWLELPHLRKYVFNQIEGLTLGPR